jgi:hypothetical protein
LPITSKALVNNAPNKVVNIASTKNDEEKQTVSLATQSRFHRHGRAQPFIERRRFRSPMPGHPRLRYQWQCKTWMPGTLGAKTRFALLPGHDGDLLTERNVIVSAGGELTPGRSPSCRARLALRQDARSALGRASTRHNRDRSRGKTRPRRDRRHARRKCRP